MTLNGEPLGAPYSYLLRKKPLLDFVTTCSASLRPRFLRALGGCCCELQLAIISGVVEVHWTFEFTQKPCQREGGKGATFPPGNREENGNYLPSVGQSVAYSLACKRKSCPALMTNAPHQDTTHVIIFP